MAKPITRTITAHLTNAGAKLNLSYNIAELTTVLQQHIQTRLAKKGIGVTWIPQAPTAELLVRITNVDQGNQLMRWLIPFSAPAVLDVEGQFALTNTPPQQFRYDRRAHFGVFGGTPQGMLNVCASVVASKITNDLLRRLKP